MNIEVERKEDDCWLAWTPGLRSWTAPLNTALCVNIMTFTKGELR